MVIKIDFKETGCQDVTWMELTQDRIRGRASVLPVLNILGLIPGRRI
jgi:hypothetical protein